MRRSTDPLRRAALVINLKTAKALGLTVPDRLLARADEVIEYDVCLLRLLTAAYGTKRRLGNVRFAPLVVS